MAGHEQATYEPSEEELQDLEWSVAEQIAESGVRYDQIIGVARGGIRLAFVVSKLLEIQDVQTLRAFSYVPTDDGITEKRNEGTTTIMLPLPHVNKMGGKDTLITEDLIDTGGTIQDIIPLFPEADYAFLYSKLDAEKTAKIATYCGKLLERGEDGQPVWIDFPYDKRKREVRAQIEARRADGPPS